MAIFGTDKEKEKDTKQKAAEEAVETSSTQTATRHKPAKRIDNSRHDVLVKPHITEKATYMTDDGVYAFVVKDAATKPQIKQAMKDVYGVSVKKVRTVNLPKKRVSARARRAKDGTKGGLKKAYVQLREGDSIELM